jgi:hypothetical protein
MIMWNVSEKPPRLKREMFEMKACAGSNFYCYVSRSIEVYIETFITSGARNS